MRRSSRALAALLVTAGLAVLAFAAWQLVGGDVAAGLAQAEATRRLDREPPPAVVGNGDPVARITIPRLGTGWGFTVLEGTGQDVLADGPGHYTGTPMPGLPGNVGIAGHRVGRGSPFDGLGDVRPCDDVVVRTRAETLTYRVLPLDAGAPSCAGVPRLDDAYAGVPGREIVSPDRVDVLATVPGRPGARPERVADLLTLTTCHPRWSARQRLVLHAVLVARDPVVRP